MKQHFLMVFLCLSFLSNAPLHKDRIERPQQYKFVFRNKDTITLKTPNGSLSDSYNDAIANGKKKIVEAELTFATGEKLFFKKKNSKWVEIFITFKDEKVNVPINPSVYFYKIIVHQIKTLP